MNPSVARTPGDTALQAYIDDLSATYRRKTQAWLVGSMQSGGDPRMRVLKEEVDRLGATLNTLCRMQAAAADDAGVITVLAQDPAADVPPPASEPPMQVYTPALFEPEPKASVAPTEAEKPAVPTEGLRRGAEEPVVRENRPTDGLRLEGLRLEAEKPALVAWRAPTPPGDDLKVNAAAERRKRWLRAALPQANLSDADDLRQAVRAWLEMRPGDPRPSSWSESRVEFRPEYMCWRNYEDIPQPVLEGLAQEVQQLGYLVHKDGHRLTIYDSVLLTARITC